MESEKVSRNRRILSAISISSGSSIATVFLSLFTNKLIAITLGPAGIGLMGIFRSFSTILSRFLGMGIEAALNQKISELKSSERIYSSIGAAALFCAIQILPLLLFMFLFGDLLVPYFQTGSQPIGVSEVRALILMSFLTMSWQLVISIMSGSAWVKRVSAIQFFTALASLILIKPLLTLGPLGLAINVGSGNLVGLLVGIIFLKTSELKFPGFMPLRSYWIELKSLFQVSHPLIIHPLIAMGSIFLVQYLIGQHFGSSDLGCYVAAFTIIETMILILMASVRSYFLPMLGKSEHLEQKMEFQNRMIFILLLLLIAAAVCLSSTATFVMRILFSKDFSLGAELIKIMCVISVAQGLTYCYNAVLLHHQGFRKVLLIDSVWAIVHLAGVYLAISQQATIQMIVWMIGASHIIAMILYMTVVAKTYGLGRFRENFLLTAFGFGWLFIGQKLPASLPFHILYLLVAALVLGWAFKASHERLVKGSA